MYDEIKLCFCDLIGVSSLVDSRERLTNYVKVIVT